MSNTAPFSIGQRIAYRNPVNIEAYNTYDWEWHTGTLTDINLHSEQLTVTPLDEAEPWRIVS